MRSLLPAAVAAAFLVVAAPLAAQRAGRDTRRAIESAEAAEDKGKLTPEFDLFGGVRALIGASWQGSGGRLTTVRYDAGLRYQFPVAQNMVLGITPFGRQYAYDFDGPTPFGVRSPWGGIEAPGVAADLFLRLDEDWSVLLGSRLERAHEAGAVLGSTSVGTVGLGFWKLSDNFTLIGGAFHLFGIENNFTVPIIAFDWDLAEEVGVTTEDGGLRVEVRPHEDWTVNLGFAGDGYQARLSPNAVVPNGVLQVVEFDVGMRVRWEPEPERRITFGIFTNLYKEFELQNFNGGFAGRARLNPGLLLILDIEFRF